MLVRITCHTPACFYNADFLFFSLEHEWAAVAAGLGCFVVMPLVIVDEWRLQPIHHFKCRLWRLVECNVVNPVGTVIVPCQNDVADQSLHDVLFVTMWVIINSTVPMWFKTAKRHTHSHNSHTQSVAGPRRERRPLGVWGQVGTKYWL